MRVMRLYESDLKGFVSVLFVSTGVFEIRGIDRIVLKGVNLYLLCYGKMKLVPRFILHG